MKKNARNSIRVICLNAMVVGAAMLPSGCAVYPEGTLETGGYYDYDYYPDAGVYFYPRDRIYYWNDGGYWHRGRRLPPNVILHGERHEELRLHTRRPWTEHRPELRERGPETDEGFRHERR